MVNLANEPKMVDTSLDSIVIVNVIETLVGGRELNVTGFDKDVIAAGHLVIKEDATNIYKPMPLTEDGDEYDSLPQGYSYVGVVGASVLAKRAACSIVVRGTVNEVASPFAVPADAKQALHLIRFVQD